MDDVKAKLDNVHKLLKKQVSFAEDVEAVDVNSDKDFEEDVNLISGTGFRFRSLKIRMDTETPMTMDRGLTSTRVHSTRNPTSATSTTAATELMEIFPIIAYHHRLERRR